MEYIRLVIISVYIVSGPDMTDYERLRMTPNGTYTAVATQL